MLSTAKWKKTLTLAQSRVRKEPLWLEGIPLLREERMTHGEVAVWDNGMCAGFEDTAVDVYVLLHCSGGAGVECESLGFVMESFEKGVSF